MKIEEAGQLDLIDLLNQEIKKVENSKKNIERAAKTAINDLNKLPAPFSRIRKSGYTHLVRTFSYKMKNGEAVISWGKYYGPMVERGTKKMKARPHVEPLIKKNLEKYHRLMMG